MRHLYFAYGSNMLVERLRSLSRAPSACPVAHALLEGWQLRFDKRSRDGSGKCHIERKPGACAHGVVYLLDENDFRTLDLAEGVGAGYERVRIGRVLLGDGTEVNAITYLAEPSYVVDGLAPYDWYRDLVLAGAEQHQLPQEFITQLDQTSALPDPVPDRATRQEAIKLLATLQANKAQGLFSYQWPASARLQPEQALEHLTDSPLASGLVGKGNPLATFALCPNSNSP